MFTLCRSIILLLCVLQLVQGLSLSRGMQKTKTGKAQASYFYMDANGGYKYGFDTGEGFTGAQAADPTNEVTGHYIYYDDGLPHMVKYRAGRQGYQPQILEPTVNTQILNLPALQATPTLSVPEVGTSTKKFVEDALKTMQNQDLHISFATHVPDKSTTIPTVPSFLSTTSANIQKPLKRRPYNFVYLSPRSSHSEQVDHVGNVLGKYSYYDEAGYHDLAYKAGDDIGFVVLGGNLSQKQAQTTNVSPTQATLTTSSPQIVTQLPRQYDTQAAQVVVNVSHLPGGSYSYKWESMPNYQISNNVEKRRRMALNNQFRHY